MPFLTPNPPDAVLLVTVEVPDTLLPLLIGSLLSLDEERYWEAFGSLSVDEVLVLASNMIWTLAEGPFSEGKVGKVVYVESEGRTTFVTDDNGNLVISLE